MKTIEIESSVLSKAAYDGKDLYVTMKSGKTYKYKDVPCFVYGDFEAAESKGRFYNQNIKGIYEGEKVEENLN